MSGRRSRRSGDHFNGKTVAITGAASGIGQALAVELARRGAEVALSDVDAAGLASTVALAEGHGPKVTANVVDVADREAMLAWADQVVADHGKVNVIINNAGVALIAPVAEMSHDDFVWLMDINFWGVVHGTQAFLPHLEASGDGHVVNVSSVFGLQSIPTQSAYNAAKFAVRGFTDALRIELEMNPCGVSATSIHPGGIKTNLVRTARVDESVVATEEPGFDRASEFDKVAMTTPERAARKILSAVEKDRRRALVGPDAVLFDAVSRLPAGLSQRLAATLGRRSNSSLRRPGSS